MFKTQGAVLVIDVHNSSRWSSEVDQALGFNTNALMCAPLFNNEKTDGAIEVISNMSSNAFDENDPSVWRLTAHVVSRALP